MAEAEGGQPGRAPGFQAGEYRARTERLQAAMAGDGLDALLLTTPADIFYVSGFLTRFWESPARPWFVIVPGAGAPIAVIPEIGADLMRHSWLRDIRTWPSPNPSDEGLSLLAQVLTDLVPDHGRIGLPMGPETHLRMPLADYAALVQRVAPRRFADATACVRQVREIKSEAEIAAIRDACAVAGRAFARVPDFAAPGRPLEAVFRELQIACLDEGADWVSYLAGAAGPGGYGTVISPADARPLAEGDVLMLDTGLVRAGYYCDFDRNFAVGALPPDVRRAQDALWTATEEALASLRPGLRACEVHALLVSALERRGVEAGGGRLGHGLGITLTEWPSFLPRDETLLREGMVLTLEPGAVVRPGRNLVHEEVVVLRAQGAELLSPRAPREMPEIRG